MNRASWNWNIKDAMKVINGAIADDRDIAVLDLYNNTDTNIAKIEQQVRDKGFDVTRDADSVIVYL